ncbi:integrase/recombinase xerD homolog isoform X1 [Oculina patagonica]
MYKDADREQLMDGIEERRRVSTYIHNCTEDCKKRGCGKLWVIDGNWKLRFPHCMYKVKNAIPSLPMVNYPDICAATPERGKAFCKTHCSNLSEQGIPTGLKEFLEYCSKQDVFQSEMWREFYSSIPDHLQPLASRVQETVLVSKADGTIRSYLAGFKRWKHWALSNCFIHMPANSFHVAVYLQCLILDANSPSPVLNAVYSIDWAQQLAGLPKVSVHPMVASLVSASQRILGKPKSKKEPVTPEMLKTLVNSKISDKCPSLSDLKTVALCLIGYAGFFRFSELCAIRACDIKFFPTYVSIFLESSKTDQFRDGAWIAIARSDQETCPVKALEQYIAAAKIDLCEDLPLFRALSSPRSTSTVRRQGLSYTRAREIVKDAFKDITDVSCISLHSLRAGGATAAANAGIVDRLFKRHGRWQSENAKDGYVKDNFESLLSVSKSLGI